MDLVVNSKKSTILSFSDNPNIFFCICAGKEMCELLSRSFFLLLDSKTHEQRNFIKHLNNDHYESFVQNKPNSSCFIHWDQRLICFTDANFNFHLYKLNDNDNYSSWFFGDFTFVMLLTNSHSWRIHGFQHFLVIDFSPLLPGPVVHSFSQHVGRFFGVLVNDQPRIKSFMKDFRIILDQLVLPNPLKQVIVSYFGLGAHPI